MKEKSLQYSAVCPQEVREGLRLHFLPVPVKVPFQMILGKKGVIGKFKDLDCRGKKLGLESLVLACLLKNEFRQGDKR